MTSFWNIVGGMGASLCIPSFMRICELLPPKLHYPEILVLLSLLTEISLPSVQNLAPVHSNEEDLRAKQETCIN